MNYAVIAVVLFCAISVAVTGLKENDLISVERKKTLLALAPIISVAIILDTIGFWLEGGNINVLVYRSVKIAEFIIVPIIPALMAKAISRKSYWRKIKKYYYILVSFNTLFELLNFIFPIAFVITEDLSYRRTIIGYLYLINVSLCIFLFIKCSINAFVQNSSVSKMLISMAIFICSSVTMRIFLDKCNCDWIAITFCYFSIIQLHDNNYLKVDGLTKLLNRKAYDNRVNGIKLNSYRTALIIIDANDFKSVNDEFGHDYGDWALAKIGEAIQNIFSDVGYCYRYGGDEFTVILKEGVIKRWQETMICQDKYELVIKYMTNLKNEILRMSKECDDSKHKQILSNGISQGFGVYLPDLDDISYQTIKEESENRIEAKTWEEVFQIADNRMYKEKKNYHKKRATKRNRTQ